MFYFKEHYNFPRFQGRGPTFSRGCGSNCLCLWKPIELVIFQEGGPDPPVPLLDPCMPLHRFIEEIFSCGENKIFPLLLDENIHDSS